MIQIKTYIFFITLYIIICMAERIETIANKDEGLERMNRLAGYK